MQYVTLWFYHYEDGAESDVELNFLIPTDSSAHAISKAKQWLFSDGKRHFNKVHELNASAEELDLGEIPKDELAYAITYFPDSNTWEYDWDDK